MASFIDEVLSTTDDETKSITGDDLFSFSKGQSPYLGLQLIPASAGDFSIELQQAIHGDTKTSDIVFVTAATFDQDSSKITIFPSCVETSFKLVHISGINVRVRLNS